MNDNKSKLTQIKELLGLSKEVKEEVVLEQVEVKAEEVVETKLEQSKLENGTVLEADSFEAGANISIVSDDERVALPVGEYKLEDGRVLIVIEEGLIDSIGEAAAESEESEEVEQGAEFVTIEDFNKAINEIKEMLTSHDEEILKKHETEKSELSAQVENLKTELSEVPASKKINSSPEAKETKINLNIISPNRRQTTQDRVMDMLFKNK